MKRALIILTVAAIVLTASIGHSDETSCRKKTAAKAASLYLVTAKQFNKCSKLVASGVLLLRLAS